MLVTSTYLRSTITTTRSTCPTTITQLNQVFFLKRPKTPLSSSPKHISSSSLPVSPPPVKPNLPLFLRPPTYTTTPTDLQKFQTWAKSIILSVGSTFSDLDNGPEPDLLTRELKWLLEDTTLKEENQNTIKLRVELQELYSLWKQRIEKRRPFQYIVGCEHWRDLVLNVEEGVLIPRPETEKIVDLVEEVVLGDKVGVMKNGLWADLGTGSGALGIAIARVLGSGGGRVIATDLSETAAYVAGFNVQRYGLQDKIEIRLGSWFEPLKDVKGELAGLVSNPPYIPSDQVPGLQAEVGRHEPRLALDGGEDGMDYLLHLCEGAASVLRPGGFFVFETNGEKQSSLLVELMNQREGRFENVRMVPDFTGIMRFVCGICK